MTREMITHAQAECPHCNGALSIGVYCGKCNPPTSAALTEGATMKDSHGQTVQCAHDYDKNVDFPKICNRCGFSPDGGWLQRTADNVRKEVATWPSNSSFPTTPTIVQDYRDYTADEILYGILKFTEQAGWGDPANLGHWLGAAQRWALKERV